MLWFVFLDKTSIARSPHVVHLSVSRIYQRRESNRKWDFLRGCAAPGDAGPRRSDRVRRLMARKSLKPQLNQIRVWVGQGRTDAWIAHQLEVPVAQLETFKQEFELTSSEGAVAGFDEVVDLRAADDAQVAAALEIEEAEQAKAAEEEARLRAERIAAGEDEPEDADSDDDGDANGDGPSRSRRGRRGGRGRRSPAKTLEGSFDHGEEGYGLWLDPAIAENAVYAEHWAGKRSVTVTVEADRIVIRRADDD